MGFIYEQYELYDNNNYSNASGWLKGKLGIGSGKVKQALGIGDGKVLGIVVNPTKNAQYEANKYIISGQAAIDEQKAIDEKKALDVVEEAKAKKELEEAKKIAEEKAKQDAINAENKTKIDNSTKVSNNNVDKKSNTLLYVGIGVGVLAIVTTAIIIIKRR